MTATEETRDLEVTTLERLGTDVLVLGLADPAGGSLPAWEPGAHIDLHIGPALERQYSLTGQITDATRWTIAVLHEPAGRGGSDYIHKNFEVGTTVRVTGPRNHFELVPSPSYIFIAGGIGITPIVPMIRGAEAAGSAWTLYYGGRMRSSMSFLDDLLEAYPGKVVAVPQDTDGFIDLPGILGEPRPDTLVYCCGPEPLLQAVEEKCSSWPKGSLHTERFAAKASDPEQVNEAFEIEIDSTGDVYTVPANRAVLDVVREAGINVVSSCREGTCGTCETGVFAGRVQHRDSILDEDEREANDVMYICVSRAESPRLVLDL